LARHSESIEISDTSGRSGQDTLRRDFLSAIPVWLVGILAAWLYYSTSASTITWVQESEDSGELAACAATLGIPHPTGYPLYTMFGWAAIHLFPSLDPGRVMVLLSVAFGAISVGIIARTAAVGINLIAIRNGSSIRNAGWWGALAAGYAAVNPLLWSQEIGRASCRERV
jgi:hypothetical protein